MSHMVIFRTPEGKPGYQPAETVQEAVSIVERLRNDEGVENVRIFRLEEVQFELRPYYKVELADPGSGDASNPAGDEADTGSGTAPSIFGGSSGNDADETRAEATDTTATEAADESDESSGEAPAPTAAHPPWAAPPPPPSPVDPPPGAPLAGSGDELSGAGQRRGLFGR